MIDEGKKLLLGYTDIDILSNREFSIVQKYTFGAFYLHFLAETKKNSLKNWVQSIILICSAMVFRNSFFHVSMRYV